MSVAGYNIYRNGVQVATVNTPSYSDNSLSSNTSYSYAISAYDAAGNTSAQTSSVTVTTQAQVIVPSAGNSITLTNKGNPISNYPVQLGRPFVQGEIPSGNQAQVTLDGKTLPTQVDVKSRWSDGSLKHAVISFIIPTFSSNQTITATFGK